MAPKEQKKERYLARDVSWMYFNHRILLESQKPNVPVLEKLSFLGIYSNNLDEFFRVRVASLNRVVEYADAADRSERENAKATLKKINALNAKFTKEYTAAVANARAELRRENIIIVDETELTDEQRDFIRDFYYSRLVGQIYPIWLSEVRQFSDASDDSIHLALRLASTGDKPRKDYALLELPVAQVGRFVKLPDQDGRSYIMYLDDVIRACMPYIFKGMGYDTFEAFSFKFTKDAEMEIDSDMRNSLMTKISKGVKNRKRGLPIRFLYDEKMPKDLLRKIVDRLDVDSLDTILAGGRYNNHKDLMKFPDCGRNDLKYPKWPSVAKKELNDIRLLDAIRQKDRFLHVPYHSFGSYIQLLREAAISKEVRSIKTTLYRLAKDSQVIRALINAARNGKKVTVVIELMARFDEASNIEWSKKMQDAGVHVIFGVEGLKIHSKITHITTRVGNIAVISTGNFHEGNARAYTDYMLMTARKPIVNEVGMVFDFIEKPYKPVAFKELIVSPNEMRKKIVALINQEIKNAHAGKPAYIKGKINHIVDEGICDKLYEASQAGVPINMLVRGNCSLFTGVPGLSENIHLKGIIDRYLEHSRILIFCNGGEEKIFIGSADWMQRNLDRRIEVYTPVYDPDIQADLRKVVDLGLADNMQTYLVDGTGANTPCDPDATEKLRSQELLYQHYSEMK